MKRMLWSVLAVAGMFFFASCSKDDAKETGSVDADYVEASFTVNSPEEVIGTRANDVEIGDGTKADKVVCAVFDCKGEEMDDLRQILDIENKQAKYSIRLAKGQDYRVVFFAYHAADNSDQPEFYNIDDLKNIQIYDAYSNVEDYSNVEERDAFTAYTDVKHGETMQPINRNVDLYRPFAQLNLGTEYKDWEAAIKAGVEVAKTKIVVSNVYKTFSAFDDAVVGEPSEATYNLNTKPADALKVTIDGQEKEYVYLALNYLLVGDKRNEKNLTDVEFIWKNAAGDKTNNPTTVFHNIPVQRNYRTNIIGWLLTNAAEFNITIDERFEKPDYNIIAVDGTQDAEDIAENKTHSYVDEGNREIAVIENMHITADGTAIVVDGNFNAASGTLLVSNSTINAKLFMELNKYYTIIVRKCHLNVEQLFKITTGKTAYQIIFSDCYLNGEPMVKEKKNEYFTDDFLSLNTVNIYFNGDDSYVGGDDDNQGGNDDGDDDGGNQGGNDDGDDDGNDDGNDDGGNQGGETAQDVKMSEAMNSLGEVYNNQFFYIHDKEFNGKVTIDAKAYGDLYYFENVTFNDYIYIKKSQTLIFDNCTFAKKGLVINQSGDTTVQIQAKNCKLANGDAIESKDIKTW